MLNPCGMVTRHGSVCSGKESDLPWLFRELEDEFADGLDFVC